MGVKGAPSNRISTALFSDLQMRLQWLDKMTGYQLCSSNNGHMNLIRPLIHRFVSQLVSF